MLNASRKLARKVNEFEFIHIDKQGNHLNLAGKTLSIRLPILVISVTVAVGCSHPVGERTAFAMFART